jgi:hypothetical protein
MQSPLTGSLFFELGSNIVESKKLIVWTKQDWLDHIAEYNERMIVLDRVDARQEIEGLLSNSSGGHEVVYNLNIKNLKDSPIIVGSHVEGAFNKLSTRGGSESQEALSEIGNVVMHSGNRGAGEIFDEFTREIDSDKPRKGVLQTYWDGLVKVLPDIARLSAAAAKIISSVA